MRTNEQKLEMFADLLEPVGAIISDKRIALAATEKGTTAALRLAITLHKREIVEILARMEDKKPEEYQIDGLVLFLKLFKMFNRPDIDIDGLFTSQAQTGGGASSGSATENTEDGAK